MKKLAVCFSCMLLLCSIVDARAPLESYKRYMFVLVHGIGANTMKPHDYKADPENSEHEDFPRKSSIWDQSKDDLFSENWFGDIAGSLQSRGFLGHVVWYDFYEPWKSPILGDGRYGTSLSQYLGDRTIDNNPMGEKHIMDGGSKQDYFGSTAQTYWLNELFPDLFLDSIGVKYIYNEKGPFLELAKKDWESWNIIQEKAGLKNEETPKKYILMAHSMGGLTTRDYITSDFYKGDVDKLITLDSPHEGSAIANYVQYWKEANERTGEVFGFYGASTLLTGVMGLFMTSKPADVPPLLGMCTALFAPVLFSQLETMVGQILSGYESVKNEDTGVMEDHAAYGIDVMALDDKNNYGLYQSDTKQFLKEFNERTSVGGKNDNGYDFPYFRIVSTSGVSTPGGPGFHKGTNTMGVSLLSKMFGGIFPFNMVGESGSFITGASSFDFLFKTLVAMATNSLWNDWGSGFVPHWSAEGKNVKIFNNPKADTKRWNIAFDNTNDDEATLGLIPFFAGIGVTESIASSLFANPAFKIGRFIGYLGLVAGYMQQVDGHEWANLGSYIAFHGAMVNRVDSDKVGVKTRGGVEKKLLDELLWEKPSVSIVYKPVDPQDKSNSQGGQVGISTTKELVEFTASDKVDSYVDVKWKNETKPHVFELSLDGAFDDKEVKRLKTISIVDWFKNTTVTEVALQKVDEDKTLKCDKFNSVDGLLTCEIPMSDEDKGNYTMKLKVENADKEGVTYGVMVDIGRTPGATFVSGDALFDVQDGDWEKYVTFKNRRKQVNAKGVIDETVADMVDYRRASNLVVNKLPRMFEFEVDDLQPDRMNRLTVDFNYGTAKIEFEAINDPNKFNIPYTGEGIASDAVEHGFVNTADEEYKLKVSIGSESCVAGVYNPVDAWGKWILDLDDIQKGLSVSKGLTLESGCSIEKFQPFLEGQNHISIFSENRWKMSRTQDLNVFIPGPPPTISLVYPRNGEVFCGKTKLEFETNLIYALSSDLTNDDISVYYMDGNNRVDIPSSELIVSPKKNTSSITAYSVTTNNEIAWPKESVIYITVKPKILGIGATPFTYLLKISQDCVNPTVVIGDGQDKYNPTTVSFESYDQIELDGTHNSVVDEIVELTSKDGVIKQVLSASKFTAPGEKIRTIELNDDLGNKLPDGKYDLSVRVHDGVIKNLDSDNERRNFWESYNPKPDMTLPFASYCNDGELSNKSKCMTHWAMASTEIIIDNTAPTVESSKFVLKKDDSEFDLENVKYAGDATNKNLVLKMRVSDANFDSDNLPVASIEFTQVDLIGSVLNDGHHIVQQMEGEYKNGKIEYSHDVIKALTEDLKNMMNAYQSFPDGVYHPVVKIVDAAKNVTAHPLPVVIVDMTAPMITEVNVPYTVKSGMMHIVTFKVDESKDDLSLTKLTDVRATVNAKCGDKTFSYGKVSSYGVYPQINFAFETQIPEDVSGECLARIEVYDVNNNVRYAELSFIVDFIPPEITYPEKAKNGNPAELYGRVIIRGSAGNPNLRKGGSFTKYELTYAEIDYDGSVKGNWEGLGMTVPEGRRCNNPSNVSCSPVEKSASGDILGYWDLSKLADDAKGKNYRIKIESFNEGGFSERDFVDVFVTAATKSMPSITISDIPSNECFFEEDESTCNIRWNTDFPLEQKSGQVRMEILRNNVNGQATFVDVERVFSNVIPKEFYGAPHDASAKGAYIWIDRNDLNQNENIYHLRLTAGSLATQYAILFSKSKGADVKIYADDNSGKDLSQSLSDLYSSLNANLNAGESRSYTVKCDAKSRLAWSLQSSVVIIDDKIEDMKFMYSGNNEDEEMVFVGENAIPVVSRLHQSEIHLPQTSSIDQFIWDGKNDALASVPSGNYRIMLTLEGLEDGVYAVAQKDITVIGRPVVLSNVDATPKQVPFDVTYMEKNVLKPVHVTFSFNIDQDAVISAYVHAVGENRKPDCEYMKFKVDGNNPVLNKYYLSGRKDNYLINWDGHYGGAEQATAGDYEFVVQIHGLDGEVIDSRKVAFSITDEQMIVDSDAELKVDGKNEKYIKAEGRDYQIVEGMNDAVLQFAPAGKTVVTDNVYVKARFSGEQMVNALPFERYSVGVQVHKTTAEFWVVIAMSFKFLHETPYFTSESGWASKLEYYGKVSFNEGGDFRPIHLNFDPGENNSDGGDGKYMKSTNATLFFIPTYSISETEVKNIIHSKRSVKERYSDLRGRASAVLTWGSTNGEGVIYGLDGGITTYAGEKDDIYKNEGAKPSVNSTDIYWDERCDVGTNAASCRLADGVKPDCSGDASGKCGNGIADDGEPMLGTTERYNSLKHSHEFEAIAWAWRNNCEKNQDYNTGFGTGYVGGKGFRNHLMLIAQVKPTDRFWGKTIDPVSGATKMIGYGNGNIVNRYLTLDPMNENFLFCDDCAFSDNKTPFLNPRHPQHYELVTKEGTFVPPLHNGAFYKFHEIDGTIVPDKTLQDDVQLIFHYFQINPNNEIYAGKPFHLDATVSQADRNYQFPFWTAEDYIQGGYFTTPISLAGFGGEGMSIDVDISMLGSETFDLSKNQVPALWPLNAATSMTQSTCGINGCGSKISDEELYITPNALETENVICDYERCYKTFVKEVKLGPQNSDYNIPYLDNGYDLRPDLNNWQTSITDKNPLVKSIELIDVVVYPEGYKYSDGIVRKNDVGCDENGCDYNANLDPLISNADLDDDSNISEDGSSVTLTKEMPYNSDLDVDRDLAMGEDPNDAFRVRLPSMAFPFEAGASTQSTLLEYSVGDLMGKRLSELQQKSRDKMKSSPTIADENSVLKQIDNLTWTDNPKAKTQWESSNNPAFFERTKLFYKDGKVNNDVKIVKSENMDDHNAMRGKIWIGPNDFSGRDRRLLEVRAKIPNMQENETYKLYASSEIGWIDLTPSTTVEPKSGKIDGLIAYWDVETSGMHQLMLVRNADGERKYKTVDVFVGAMANEEKTIFSDAMGRSQVQVASGTKYIDVIPLGKNEVPQTIPSNKNLGPVVKIYPSVSTIGEEVSLRLRFNKSDIPALGWTDNGSLYVVSEGNSPQRVDGVTWVYYDEENEIVSSKSDWSYVIVSGVVPNAEQQQKELTSVKLGELATFNNATVSVTESSNGLYNLNFNPGVNP